MVSFFGTETSPSSGDSSRTTMRKSVVLPAPLGPTRPTFSPGFNWKDASTKINCLPYCLLILEKEIIETPEWGGAQAGNLQSTAQMRAQWLFKGVRLAISKEIQVCPAGIIQPA